MKQLQLTPPLLLLVMGYPGSGKTYFTRQFTAQHNIPRVSQDRIRFELFENPQFTPEEHTIVERVQNYMSEELIQAKQTFVCEGSFLTFKERKQLQSLAKQGGYHTLTVWVQTDIETSKLRSTHRDKRNVDNKYEFSLTPHIFDQFKNSLQRPEESEISVVISGKHSYKTQAVTVLRKIASLYSENMTRQDFALQARKPELLLRRPAVRRMVQ